MSGGTSNRRRPAASASSSPRAETTGAASSRRSFSIGSAGHRVQCSTVSPLSAQTATAALPPTGGRRPRRDGGQLRRHRHRVVRLLPLRHGGRARVRPALLPERRSAHRHAVVVRDLRRGLHRPPARRHRLWPLRRSRRAPVDADLLAGDHGCRHLPHRPAAHVRHDRRVGACPAGPVAVRAGHWRRRRVGRSGAHGRRAFSARAPRTLGKLASDGRSGRVVPVDGRLRRGQHQPGRRGIPRVGLARAVPLEPRAHRRRLVHPSEDSRVAGIREAAAERSQGSAAARCRRP